MSLKVWLPLNGNLDNLGTLSLTSPTAESGATVNNNGKIGKCYSFSGETPAKIYYTHDKAIWADKEISFAAWFKSDKSKSSGTIMEIAADLCMSYQYSSSGVRFGYWRAYLSNGSRAGDSDWISTYFNADAWHHVVVVFNHELNLIYVDGNLVQTFNSSSYYTSNFKCLLGSTYNKIAVGWSNGASSNIGGLVNDVRIYDHALSQAEIHELSQGLVLHYKLDDVIGFTDLTSRGASYNIYNNHGANMPATLVNTGKFYNDDIVFRETCTPTDNSLSSIRNDLWSHGVYNWNKTFKANTKYVFWIYYKPISHSDTVCGGTASNIGGWTEIPPVAVGGGWYKVGQYRDGSVTSDKTDNIFVSFKVPSAVTGTPIIIDWASPHLLEGTTEIPSYDYPSTKIIDNSGNGYNGTVSGALNTESNSPRNKTNIHINANSQHIVCATFPTSGFGNSYSFAWWGKCASFSNTMHWGFSDGIRLNGLYNGNLWNTGDGGNNPLYTPGTTTQVAAPSTGVWHHYVMTGDGTTCKVYKDGEYWAVAKTYKAISGTQIFINGWQQNTDYCHSNLSMSDFRIYATALSANDVKELYHTEAKVVKGNNIHTFEFSEYNTENITNNGIVEGRGMYESPATDTLKYDKTIYTEPDGSKWVRIFHHDKPASNLFDYNSSWKDGVYKNTNVWFDVYGNIELAPKYELMVKQKTTDSATETKYRWIQYKSPLTAVWDDVKPASVTRITTSGYTDGNFGGLYILNTNTHMVIANSNNGNWYGATGCYTVYSGGIPGYPNTTITSGYMDLYIRIYPNVKFIKNTGFSAEHLIEM